MAASDFVSKPRRRPMILSAVAAVLLAGSLGCACYSLSCFLTAQGRRSEFASRLRAREQHREAAELEKMIGLFSGVGPVGADIAAVAMIWEMEKAAWQYLCFALTLGVGGFHLIRYSLRHRWIAPRELASPVPAAPDSPVKSSPSILVPVGRSPHGLTRETRGTPMKRPISLVVVASLFLLMGAGAASDMASDLFAGRINFNLGVLCFFVGAGLLRHQQAWRLCALSIIGLGFIAIALFAGFGLFGGGQVIVFGREVGAGERPWAVLVVVVVSASVLGWMSRVLTRRSVRDLFSSPPS